MTAGRNDLTAGNAAADDDHLANYKRVGRVVAAEDRSGVRPSYELASRIRQRTLDPGDDIVIEVYITGFGQADSAKLAVFLPTGLFKEDSTPAQAGPGNRVADLVYNLSQGTARYTGPTLAAARSGEGVTFAASRLQRVSFGPTGIVLGMHGGFFMEAIRGTDDADMTPVERSLTPVRTAGEVPWDGKPPIEIDGTIDPDAPSGSHTVTLVLTYSYREKGGAVVVQSCRADIEVYVRPFWERAWFQAVGVGIAIVGVAAAVAEIVAAVTGK